MCQSKFNAVGEPLILVAHVLYIMVWILLQHYKAYAMHRHSCNLFVLFDKNTQTFAMR